MRNTRSQTRWYAEVRLVNDGQLIVLPSTRAIWEDSIGNPAYKFGQCIEETTHRRMFWRAQDSINHRIAQACAWEFFNSILQVADGIPF